jgi:ribosomal protein L22
MKKTVVFSFGRMNPMTNGHEKLADKLQSEAKKRNADARLYLSHSTNPKKDPLDFNTKFKFAKKAFGPMVQNSNAKVIFQVLEELNGKYDNIVMVVGSDRVQEFETIIKKYNGKGDYEFKSIEVISAGERDPDAEGVTGMSASKMRGFAAADDFDNFRKGVPSKFSDADAKALFTAVKKGMNLKEEFEQQDEAVLDFTARRKRAMIFKKLSRRIQRARMRQMRKIADPERLKRRAAKAAIKFFRSRLSGGQNYADLGTGQKIAIDTRLQKLKPIIKKFAVRLLPKVRSLDIERKKAFAAHQALHKEDIDVNDKFTLFIEAKLPQDKDIGGKEGTQPAKYYVGMDKDTKEKRDAHFKQNGPKSDSDPDSYKDAPGDKEARERGMPQSKHTKKYKDMFGEEVDKKSMNRLDQLVRMGLADKKLLTVIKRSIDKLDSGDMLNPNERKATQDLLQTLLDMVLSSDALFRMTRSTLQKEDVQLDELIYKGNIGAMEMFEFFQKATPQQIAEMKKLIAEKKTAEALKLLAKVTGKKLTFDENIKLLEREDWEEVDGLQMAQIEVANMAQDIEDLSQILDTLDKEPEAWVLSKITKAADYIESVRDYLEFEGEFDDGMEDEEEDEDDGEFSGVSDDEDDFEMEMEETFIGMDKEEFGDLYEEVSELFEEIEGLQKKAEKSGISYGILKQVYDRGMAAWQGGHRPGTTPQQWAFARVNSFITGGKTRTTADADLWKKVKKNEEFSKFTEALEWGTDEMRKAYARTTPGQSEDIINAKYSAKTALEYMNNANTQRLFKIYSEDKKDDTV